MRKFNDRLTYANVMATIGVFIALGGTGLAASQFGKNSVGSKQLKRNAVITAKIANQAVTGAKIKVGTLTGTQINSASLGTVPRAANSQALEGQSASQLLSASKLHCPSGMALYSGVCYEEAARSAAEWERASETCWEEGLHLPTFSEVLGFETNNFKVQPPQEWTEPDWFDGTTVVAWAASASESSTSWGPEAIHKSHPYRCVTLASN